VLEDRLAAEQEVAGIGILPRLAIDAKLDGMTAGRAELVRRDDPRADRAAGVEPLAIEPLAVRLLEVARRDFVI
jgi:hypothetical protein